MKRDAIYFEGFSYPLTAGIPEKERFHALNNRIRETKLHSSPVKNSYIESRSPSVKHLFPFGIKCSMGRRTECHGKT